jgi:hypothetical protein
LLWLFERQGLTLCPDWPGPQSYYFTLLPIAGMTVICHHAQIFPLRWGSHTFFA